MDSWVDYSALHSSLDFWSYVVYLELTQSQEWQHAGPRQEAKLLPEIADDGFLGIRLRPKLYRERDCYILTVCSDLEPAGTPYGILETSFLIENLLTPAQWRIHKWYPQLTEEMERIFSLWDHRESVRKHALAHVKERALWRRLPGLERPTP